MDWGCKRLIVTFQSWGQILSSSSVFSVLYHGLLCKSTKKCPASQFLSPGDNARAQILSISHFFSLFLAVCLLCWWGASISTPWVSWATKPSFFFLFPGLYCYSAASVCVPALLGAEYFVCAYAATLLSLDWPLLVADAHNCRSRVIPHNYFET